MKNTKPTVCLIGRPNVGKSSLFNRLTQTRQALVQGKPGSTRDRNEGVVSWDGYEFILVDAAGVELDTADNLQKKMTANALKGAESADLVLLMVDGRSGLTSVDREWIERLRKLKQHKFYVVNKIDNKNEEAGLNDFYELGLDPVIGVSAQAGRGIGALLDGIIEFLKSKNLIEKVVHEEEESEEDFEEEIELAEEISSAPHVSKIALIGKPNAGKSSLLNRLSGEERVLVDEKAGTTRDPIHTFLTVEGKEFQIIDTAGIRKRGQVSEAIEKFSIVKALEVIDEADIVMMVIDGHAGISEQDAHVAGEAFKKQKAIILLINKSDMFETDEDKEALMRELGRKLHFLAEVPVLHVSAKTGKGVKQIWPLILEVKDEYDRRIGTGELNKAFEKIVDKHPLPVFRGKNIKIFYTTQIATRPPTFVVFSNEPKHIHFSYERYLINGLKAAFNFGRVPLRIIFRKRGNKRGEL